MSDPSHDSAHAHGPQGLAGRLREATGESVFKCYQCGKCSAGCPLGSYMDHAPSQIMRMLQLGMPELENEALEALSIWLCLTCEMCGARCPKEVDLPKVMEFVRQESLRLGKVHPKAKDILAFHKSFLNSVRATGRLYEVGLIQGYKLRTMHLFQDLLVAPKLYARGKLKIRPHPIADKPAVKRIFDRTAAEEAQHT
jgi:heterodisulfide reductase subunit C2